MSLTRGLIRPLVAMSTLVMVASSAAAAQAGSIEAKDDSSGVSMRFQAEPGEANDVSIELTAQTPTNLTYRVVDETATLVAGPGCDRGGPPGSAASCTMGVSQAASCSICIGGRDASISVELEDGDDSIDTTAVPVEDGGSGGAIDVSLYGGDGADEIVAGPSAELIFPGAGSDSVLGGVGFEIANSEPTADGADHYDLGPDGGRVNYEHRTAPVELSLDGVANDGEAGEGDNLASVTEIISGSGDDNLVGGPGHELLAGRSGNDRFFAGPGDDQIEGGLGSDMISAGRGQDISHDYSLGKGDRFAGGPGADFAETGPSDDVLSGGRGRDRIHSGAGGDRVIGGAQGDRLFAGSGADGVQAGGGNDKIGPGRDDDRDRLVCGRGRDATGFGNNDLQAQCEVLRPPLFLETIDPSGELSFGGSRVYAPSGGRGGITLDAGELDSSIVIRSDDAAGEYVITDRAGVKVDARFPDYVQFCRQISHIKVRCELIEPGGVRVGLGNGDDTIEVDSTHHAPIVVAGDYSEAGDDVIRISNPADAAASRIQGYGGDDIIETGPSRDVLRGGPGDDLLRGNGGDDHLFGKRGSDVFRGGTGNDRLRADRRDKDHSIRCGGGDDSVVIDGRLDPAPVDCETVTNE